MVGYDCTRWTVAGGQRAHLPLHPLHSAPLRSARDYGRPPLDSHWFMANFYHAELAWVRKEALAGGAVSGTPGRWR